jgi:uncharacterized protein (DUF1501 family)
MNSRRQFLLTSAALGFGSFMPLSLAAAQTEQRLLVVVLRGAMDSLGALVPYSDPHYQNLRGDLAVKDSELLRLDSTFALHSALQPLLPLWQNGELLMLPASASPYRERSHFDAQNLLENGGERPHQLNSGWLNRSLQALPGANGIAIGANLPLLMQGGASVSSWSPSRLPEVNDDFLRRVQQMYASDTQLSAPLEAAVMMDTGNAMGGGRGKQATLGLFQQAATFMRGSARLASLDVDGWDTHSNQNRRLANQLELLAEGLMTFRQAMGPAWQQTAVLVITEFGRTARHNGSGGTDHGTASLAMLLGGKVRGGRWLGDWPTLNKLYQDRDLIPANDLRGLLKGVLVEHLAIDEGLVSSQIFPGSSKAPAYRGLFS